MYFFGICQGQGAEHIMTPQCIQFACSLLQLLLTLTRARLRLHQARERSICSGGICDKDSDNMLSVVVLLLLQDGHVHDAIRRMMRLPAGTRMQSMILLDNGKSLKRTRVLRGQSADDW